MKLKTRGWLYLLLGGVLIWVAVLIKSVPVDKCLFGAIISGLGVIMLDRAGEW